MSSNVARNFSAAAGFRQDFERPSPKTAIARASGDSACERPRMCGDVEHSPSLTRAACSKQLHTTGRSLERAAVLTYFNIMTTRIVNEQR